ncbi:unnamed protein product [Brachionus calyciflorus]|uniref:Uncharacterized protein n=1 Tax=Brachionus calyciflorus TaxID=104777 RepID=A0A814P507_9BILA|nr:unnamed protein product [Brachionus calyciflorus]
MPPNIITNSHANYPVQQMYPNYNQASYPIQQPYFNQQTLSHDQNTNLPNTPSYFNQNLFQTSVSEKNDAPPPYNFLN